MQPEERTEDGAGKGGKRAEPSFLPTKLNLGSGGISQVEIHRLFHPILYENGVK